MLSPITCPAGVTATSCFAISTGNRATLFTPVSAIRRSASRPTMNRFTMWCDWSNSTAVSRHARCSRLQLLNSAGTTG